MTKGNVAGHIHEMRGGKCPYYPPERMKAVCPLRFKSLRSYAMFEYHVRQTSHNQNEIEVKCEQGMSSFVSISWLEHYTRENQTNERITLSSTLINPSTHTQMFAIIKHD